MALAPAGEIELLEEWHGLPPPPGVTVPSATELIKNICAEAKDRRYPMGLAHPPGLEPTLWIKYGSSVRWEEVINQFRAHQELQGSESPVRVPAIYYACKDSATRETYIVMEYVRGETVASGIQKAHESKGNEQELEAIYRRVAFAIEELIRIPVPYGTCPSSVDGGLIRHPFFGQDHEAPRSYDNAEQLEQHLNMVRSAYLDLCLQSRNIADLDTIL